MRARRTRSVFFGKLCFGHPEGGLNMPVSFTVQGFLQDDKTDM